MDKTGSIEYLMPKKLATFLYKKRPETEQNVNFQDYLIKIVNENFGLLRKCTKVTVF